MIALIVLFINIIEEEKWGEESQQKKSIASKWNY